VAVVVLLLPGQHLVHREGPLPPDARRLVHSVQLGLVLLLLVLRVLLVLAGDEGGRGRAVRAARAACGC
jgi:hypothetical protein